MAQHENLTDIHVPYRWSYADATARTGASGFGAGDVGKLALQQDNNSLWILTATTPTWVDVGGSGITDGDAIHDDVSGEIDAITEKTSPVNADLIIIEDSADSNNKKKVQLGNLPGGSFSGASLTKSSTQSISSGLNYLSFDGENYDTDSYHDNSTNNSRLTAPEDGWYEPICSVSFEGNSLTYHIIRLVKNRSPYENGAGYHRMNGQGQRMTLPFSRQVYLSAGDYVEVCAEVSGSATVRATADGTSFTIRKVG
ncbi:MAG: hypothetical protein JEZ06_00520 [Anaerolineaceae bacterium]|nr:hypothetical protein [Anaerolineaceae bacterium]